LSQWILGMSEPELKETPKLEFRIFNGLKYLNEKERKKERERERENQFLY